MKYFFVGLLVLVGLASSAQQTTESNYRNWVRTNNTAKSKVALVIGNSKYQYTTQLAEPSNDANELANALNAQGYEVLKAFNLDRRTLITAISDFAENFGEYEEGVIYYAGHGFQVNGINYLVPTDANPRNVWQVEGECINVRYLLDAINRPDIPKLILVDACRNNPFAKSWSGEGRNADIGMRAVQALSNSIVIFSTAEETVVRDDNPFAETFARHIQLGGCVEGDIIGRVAVDISKSNPNQLIRPTGFLFNNICFGSANEGSSTVPTPRVVESPQTQKTTTTAPDNFIRIPGGTFQMGDQFGEGDSDEKPVHTVEVSTFYLSPTEVTFTEYDAFCTATGREKPIDRGWGRGQRPAINVSWCDAVEYANWKSEQTGLQKVYSGNCDNIRANWEANGYRLPTEAEWEYAARQGGQKVRFGNGKDIADPAEINFDGNWSPQSYSKEGIDRQKTVPVGSLNSPNSLGLHDMSGNVWEWCWDWFDSDYYKNSPRNNPQGPTSGSYRVQRGGSWNNTPAYVRCANRFNYSPVYRFSYIGFRLSRAGR